MLECIHFFTFREYCSMMEQQQQVLGLDSLPEVAVEHILQFLSYDEVAKCRAISTRFNALCKSLLNKGFRAVEKYHAKCLKVSLEITVVDSNTLNLDPDPEFCPNLDPDLEFWPNLDPDPLKTKKMLPEEFPCDYSI